MATTTPDGIWSPDNGNNFDWVAHFGQMADSIQAALNELRTEFETPDSGWLNLSPQSPLTANPNSVPQYRKVGNIVTLRGEFYSSTAPSSNPVAAILPVGFRPGSIIFATTAMFAYPDNPVQVSVNPNGNISILSGIARTSGVGYPISGISFMID